MKIRTFLALAAALILLLSVLPGCQTTPTKQDPNAVIQSKAAPIGDFSEIIAFAPIPVEGYGLVAGLPGTGSAECPPEIRNYLRQYILSQLPAGTTVSADELISSLDTAVVSIEGTVPAGAFKGEKFDLRVTALRGTQTLNLAGGTLYTAQLMPRIGSKRIATAQGPVFLAPDAIDKRSAYILGGGNAENTYDLNLALFAPNFILANAVRNRINERFGDETANAASESVISVRIPQPYAQRKQKFIALVKALYINETRPQELARINQLLLDLGVKEKAQAAEIALEAVGKTEAQVIASKLRSPDPAVRFRCARCLLAMGDETGLGILRENAARPDSPFQLDAIRALADDAKRNDARFILKPLLAQPDLKVRLLAYEALRRFEDPSVSSTSLNRGNIVMDQVRCPGPATVYAYRSGQQRFVLFGAPITTVSDVFIESDDGNIIINSDPNATYLNVIRKLVKTKSVMGPVRTSFDLGSLITTLSDTTQRSRNPGMAVPYADTLALLQSLAAKKQIKADFAAGDLPKFNKDASPAAQTPKPETKP